MVFGLYLDTQSENECYKPKNKNKKQSKVVETTE